MIGLFSRKALEPSDLKSVKPSEPQIKEGRNFFKELALFKSFMIDSPYLERLANFNASIQPPQIFTTGATAFKNCKVIGVNGIQTSFKDAQKYAESLSESLNDHQISWLYVPSHTFFQDIAESLREMKSQATEASFLLKDHLMDFFNENGATSKVYIQAHSRGVIVTKNALALLPISLRERVCVLALAPAAYIHLPGFSQIRYYSSQADFIPLIDARGLLQAKDQTTLLAKISKGGFIDHSLNSPTFLEAKNNFYQEILNQHT